MLGALISFLGGSAARALIGQVSGFFEKRQEHAQTLERMRLQAELDRAGHEQQLAVIQQQAALGIQTMQAQSAARSAEADAAAFAAAQAKTEVLTGVRWVDAWNQTVRPAAATIALGLWVSVLAVRHFEPSAWDLDMVGSVLGYFFANRHLSPGR